MKKMENPVFEIIKIEVEDIIVTSTPDPGKDLVSAYFNTGAYKKGDAST